MHAHFRAGEKQGVGHIVEAVAQIGQFQAREAALVLFNGLQVRQDLARMGKVGQRIDHRDRGGLGHLFNVLVLEQPGHDDIAVATGGADGVLDGFLAAAEG